MEITPDDFVVLLRRVAARTAAERERLSELDRAIGDGDHGSSMETGWQAALAALEVVPQPAGFQALCNAAARAFVNAVGGATGPLYATLLMRGGAAVKERASLDLDGMAAFLAAACQGIRERGKSEAGDKTMLDAWLPAIAALETARAAGARMDVAMADAARAAEQGAEATQHMVARLGRASRLGPRSQGHIDPGAASAALFFRAFAEGIAET